MEGVIAEIRIFAGNFAPRQWAFCDGQLLPIAQNTALFSLLGTTFGGDGRTTFGLPDYRSRSAVGRGNGPGLSPIQLGQEGGAETNTLTVNQLPAHNHVVAGTVNEQANNDTAGLNSDPGGKRLGSSGNLFTAANGDLVNMASDASSLQVANVGNNQSFINNAPFLGMYYIICLQGVYPSRS